MTAPRDLIRDALVAQLEGVDVEPYARPLDNLARPLVMLRLDKVEPMPTAGKWRRQYQATVLVVSHLADTDAASGEVVDQLLEDVLHAVDLSPVLRWTNAQRVVIDDAWPGWEIQLAPVPTSHQEGLTP